MNILLVSRDPHLLDAEGPSRARMRAYAATIEAAGGTLHVIAPGKKSLAGKEGALVLHTANMIRSLQIRSLVHKELIDVVSIEDVCKDGLAALLALLGTNTLLQVQVREDICSPWVIRARRMECMAASFVVRHAHGIRVVSERIKRSLVQKFGTAIHEPFVISEDASVYAGEAVALPPHLFTFALLAAGPLDAARRVKDIVSALALISVRYPSAGLFIVGTGKEEKRLGEQVRKLGLSARVIFLGERSDVAGLMKSAQAYIQASAYDDTGTMLMLAAKTRLPIITTDVGMVGDVFIPVKDVLAVPVGDVSLLAAHIKTLIEDNRAREVLAVSAEESLKNYEATVPKSPVAVVESILALARTAR